MIYYSGKSSLLSNWFSVPDVLWYCQNFHPSDGLYSLQLWSTITTLRQIEVSFYVFYLQNDNCVFAITTLTTAATEKLKILIVCCWN